MPISFAFSSLIKSVDKLINIFACQSQVKRSKSILEFNVRDDSSTLYIEVIITINVKLFEYFSQANFARLDHIP